MTHQSTMTSRAAETLTRRDWLNGVGVGLLSTLAPAIHVAPVRAADKPKSPNERLRIGSIGMRYQGSVIAEKAQAHGEIVAICDVDREMALKAQAQFNKQATLFEDYRELLQRPDIDVVTMGSPDHWHSAMVIDAVKAGKDVYVEKPLTLTVDEGRQIIEVVRQTGRIVQVGSWQRSDQRFRTAVEMVRSGRIGELKKVTVVLGKNMQGGPFTPEPPPKQLNWNLWQGPTPDVPYIKERCHYTFRWWYEYSGGQMTDWGAHHLDIAQWGIVGNEATGPIEIAGTATYPDVANGYNVAKDFSATYRYANGVVLEVLDHGRNGVMFEGTAGRLFVNRGDLEGKPVEELADRPLPREQFQLYARDNLTRPPRVGKLDAIINHMGNFFDCVRSREQPLSDVVSQHRSVTTCHLGNIAMRLGRKLHWNPETEIFVDDRDADALLKRERRSV